jgi:hypothetical protein
MAVRQERVRQARILQVFHCSVHKPAWPVVRTVPRHRDVAGKAHAEQNIPGCVRLEVRAGSGSETSKVPGPGRGCVSLGQHHSTVVGYMDPASYMKIVMRLGCRPC